MRPLLVVDGYNVLHADPAYVATARVDMDAARRRLVDDVAVFATDRYDAVIVFDGGGTDPGTPAGVRVAWSGDREADALVEALAFEARSAGRPCVVVTSDRATRDAVSGPGVDAISSGTMMSHLEEARAEWREAAPGAHRVTIADRVAPEVRRELDDWVLEGSGREADRPTGGAPRPAGETARSGSRGAAAGGQDQGPDRDGDADPGPERP